MNEPCGQSHTMFMILVTFGETRNDSLNLEFSHLRVVWFKMKLYVKCESVVIELRWNKREFLRMT